jgi:hypothetical protein
LAEAEEIRRTDRCNIALGRLTDGKLAVLLNIVEKWIVRSDSVD